jgi:hypothetical protein
LTDLSELAEMAVGERYPASLAKAAER